MANTIDLDFTGAPPSAGSFSDHVPPARYTLRIQKAEGGTAKSGRRMITVAFAISRGDQMGKKLTDFFVLPDAGGDSKVGLQRFHMLLVAIGMREQTGKAKLNLDTLIGKTCLTDVEDNTIPANGQYAERVGSRPSAYLRVQAAAPAPTPVEGSLPVVAATAAPLVATPPVETNEVVELISDVEPPAAASGDPAGDLARSVASELADLFGD